MKNNSDKLIEILNHELPREYSLFLNETGIISDSRGEVYGHCDNVDIDKIPSVVYATSLYKQEYKNILDDEIVISFDDLRNTPIILNMNDGAVYSVDFDDRLKINNSFNDWLSEVTREKQ